MKRTFKALRRRSCTSRPARSARLHAHLDGPSLSSEGFFFQVLAVNGAPPPWRSWEDVVNVPPRATVGIAWLPDDRPGSWMYHCHILEHHAAGMMAHFEVGLENVVV